MARRPATTTPARRANLSSEQMRTGLKRLNRREKDLRAFDVNTVNDHGDQNAEALRNRYNDTIAEVFGDDTHEHDLYRSWEFDQGPHVMSYGYGQPSNLHEIRVGYRRGVGEALTHIATIRQLFGEKLEDFGDNPVARVTHAFGELDIHPAIAAAAGKLVEDGHYANAVEDACKALEALVHQRSGLATPSHTFDAGRFQFEQSSSKTYEPGCNSV